MNLELSWKEGGGGLKEELFSTKVLFRGKKVERSRGQEPKKRERLQRKVPRLCQSEDFLSLSLVSPLESGHEEGTVSITQIK